MTNLKITLVKSLNGRLEKHPGNFTLVGKNAQRRKGSD